MNVSEKLFTAGCGAEIIINNVRVYGNCTCGADTNIVMEDLIATEGACGMEDCQPYWISYQALSVVAAALLGSTLIGKLIITLRSVLPQDKSSALGIELFIIASVVYIPGKLGYRFIAGGLKQKTALKACDKIFFQTFVHLQIERAST